MSETHVRSAVDIAVVDSTHSTSVEQNNNNNNDGEHINKTNSKLSNKDEIIEEFEFSDSDLEQLSNDDSDFVSAAVGVDRDRDRDRDKAVSKENESVESVCSGVAGNNNNNNNNKITNHVDNSAEQSHDNNNTKAIVAASAVAHSNGSNGNSGGDESAATCAAVGATNDKSSPNTADKRKTTPTHLELAQIDTDAAAAAPTNDSYCPITPRKIVDIEPEEASATPLLLRSGTKHSVRDHQSIDSPGTPGSDHYGDEVDPENPDEELLVQFLGEANSIAEARLAARRQARAEAREIRMRELERQQKEQEQNADRVFDMQTASGIDPLSRSRLTTGVGSSPIGSVLNSVRGNSMSSRRSSEDSLEEEGRSLRDIRHELKDVEERFRKAMIANAQLDNERASQTYQIQFLKDKLEEMEESYAQLQREFKEKSRDCNALKRNLEKLNEELKLVQGQLHERDALISEQGLVIVAVENEDGTDAKRALVTVENAQLLGSVQGSLDVRLKKFHEEKQQLLTEVQQLQGQLDNYKSQGKGRGNSVNGPVGADDDYEAQREANKIISDYKYKLQKAEQEIASLQASLARSETQVIRYKSTAEAAEKAEAELKIERRKLQRENREATERLEELETSNNHLLKRLDKLKNAKSALLKDL